MQSIFLTEFLRTPARSKEIENRRRTRDTAFISFAGGGLFFILLGFLLSVVYAVAGTGSHSALNYAAVGSLITGFVFFGFAAHFMDERDKSER